MVSSYGRDVLCTVADKEIQWNTLDRLILGANGGPNGGRERYILALKKLSQNALRELMMEC